MRTNKFYTKTKNYFINELADVAGGTIANASNCEGLKIDNIATLKEAGFNDITVFHNTRYKKQLVNTKAAACILAKEHVSLAPKQMALILHPNPYKAMAVIAQHLYSAQKPEHQVSQFSVIDETANIAQNCTIEPGVIIGADASIAEGCFIGANSFIGQGVEIGKHCTIENNVSITNTLMGNNNLIYSGAKVGQEGFGFATDKTGHYKIPHIGAVIIGNDVEIGANTCIDRGSFDDTIIGDMCRIDNLVQVGHNVKIGRGTIIAAQSGIAGSSVIGDFVTIAGQVGIAGHLTIGDRATLLANSILIHDVPNNACYMGYPAVPVTQHHRQVINLKKLCKFKQKLPDSL